MDRVERSKEKLKQLIGDATYDSIRNAPQDQKHIQEYLCSFCFGDFYTRGGLDLKTRELLILTLNALSCINEVIPEQ